MTSYSLLKDKLKDVLDHPHRTRTQVLELRFGSGTATAAPRGGRQAIQGHPRTHPSRSKAKALRKMRHPTRIRQLQGFLEVYDRRTITTQRSTAVTDRRYRKPGCREWVIRISSIETYPK
jgi:hypothetical protein